MIDVKFRSNKKLKKIDIPYNPKSTEDSKEYMTKTTGIIPFVDVNDILISEENIIYVKLYNNKFIPLIGYD